MCQLRRLNMTLQAGTVKNPTNPTNFFQKNHLNTDKLRDGPN